MKKLIIYILLALLISISMIGTIALAAPANNDTSDTTETYKAPTIPKPDLLPGPDEAKQKEKGTRSILINTILPFYGVGIIGFVGMLSIVFLIIAGVRFSTAYGNDEAIQKAKGQAMYALIGLIIAILSYAIVRIITNIKYEGNTTTHHQIETNIV